MRRPLYSRSSHRPISDAVAIRSRSSRDGRMEYEIDDWVMDEVRDRALPGETDEETILRLVAIYRGEIS